MISSVYNLKTMFLFHSFLSMHATPFFLGQKMKLNKVNREQQDFWVFYQIPYSSKHINSYTLFDPKTFVPSCVPHCPHPFNTRVGSGLKLMVADSSVRLYWSTSMPRATFLSWRSARTCWRASWSTHNCSNAWWMFCCSCCLMPSITFCSCSTQCNSVWLIWS